MQARKARWGRGRETRPRWWLKKRVSEMVVQLRKVVFVRNGLSEQSGRLIGLMADDTTSSSKPTGNVGPGVGTIVFSNL